MIQIADEPLHYSHKIGFTSSESMSIFIDTLEKYGMECDDIDFDHDYCEVMCYFVCSPTSRVGRVGRVGRSFRQELATRACQDKHEPGWKVKKRYMV